MRQRVFTAERQGIINGSARFDSGANASDLQAIHRRLDSIEARLAEMPVAAEREADMPNDQGPDDQGNEEIVVLVNDRERIDGTLAEIAVLRQSGTDGLDRLSAAGRELDAVVDATEAATNAILFASEVIERVIDDLQVHSATNPMLNELLNEAQQALGGIYEASSFQDITGQRITKVVSALRFVDERIARLETIWSAEEVVLPEPADEAEEDDESHLLNGPQLEGQALDQAAIDALFDD